MSLQFAYRFTARALHRNMKCLLAVLMCLVLSVPSFAHSTKSAYQRVNNGSWTAYNIGRDYLGSVTHIATTSGTKVAEYSYDPWGRLRSPDTQSIYTPGNEPDLFLGRGFTGHEHLTWFGLINMNARLYDPLLGRFLSPDPYVQAPDFTQNFNRYSYALNNPLKYTDKSGELVLFDTLFLGLLLGADWEKAKQMAENDLNMWRGLFTTDTNNGFWGGAAELISRFTWQLPQTLLGFGVAQLANTLGVIDDVDYLHGTTVLKSYGSWGGVTMGNFIFGDSSINASDDNPLFQHEFGHYLQSQEQGFFWIFDYAIPSFINTWHTNYDEHNAFYAEQDANIRSYMYLSEHYGNKYENEKWVFSSNPIMVNEHNHRIQPIIASNALVNDDFAKFQQATFIRDSGIIDNQLDVVSVVTPEIPSICFFGFVF